MDLDSKQIDRAVGALVGLAAGDALGVHYETGRRLVGEPRMLGGGFGGLAPGQWSDDTEMALCIAQVAATGADLRDPAAQDAIAKAFIDWYQASPPDVGIQTRQVLSKASSATAEALRLEAAVLHAESGRTAGNGSSCAPRPSRWPTSGTPRRSWRQHA